MTKTSKIILFLLLGLLAWPVTALAFTAKAGDSVNLAKGEVIDGNLYLAGANLNIEGKVTGDVICAGQTINITGTVLGDVICAGQTINIGGQVAGNLRVLASSINLTGQINKNANMAAASINTSASSSIGWEMLFAASVAELKGSVAYDLTGAANSVTISGRVGKDVKLKIDTQHNNNPGLKIASGAIIDGKVSYTDKQDAVIEQGSKISGEVTRNPAKIRQIDRKSIFLAWLWERSISLFTAIALGLLLIGLWPKGINGVKEQLMKYYGKSFGWGFVALFLTPVAILILLVSMVGLWLALLLFMAWFISLSLAKILVMIGVGQYLVERYAKKYAHRPMITMLSGIVVCWLIFSIPILGGFLAFLTTIFGLGAAVMHLKNA
ncbi:polymer-forming cytoskeletal protein [Candidatus Falkowbacteria bacterium]|nr:polymer-forming cytoskeletal protein [Candidatus Falkowbacteria bacterium]